MRLPKLLPSACISLGIGAFAVVLGCGTPTAKSALPTRPIDEGRAGVIIAKCLQKEGLQAVEGKVVKIDGKPVKVDFTVEGKEFGVAYLSTNDLGELAGTSLGKKKQLPGNPLRIEEGILEGGGTIRFVVLYSTDYQYDDTEGSDHEATVITAENKLDRDVRDFVMITRREKFK